MVADAPAPWQLRGRAYITVLRHTERLSDKATFVPDILQGSRKPSAYSYMMYVDYADSPVGPYYELLFIPGAYRFPDGKSYLTISRIYVSSLDSVVNGNRNWGIPKQLAQFEVQYGDRGRDCVRLSHEDRCFAHLQYKSWPLPIPVLGSLMPSRWRTLAQYDHDQSYVYSPSATGIALPGQLVAAQFEAPMFPDIRMSDALFSVKLPYFRMGFPEASILSRPQAEFKNGEDTSCFSQ